MTPTCKTCNAPAAYRLTSIKTGKAFHYCAACLHDGKANVLKSGGAYFAVLNYRYPPVVARAREAVK